MSQAAYTTSKKPRRFLPEPIETSSRSSKNRQDNGFRTQCLHPMQTSFRTSEISSDSCINEDSSRGSHSPPRQTDLSPCLMTNHDAYRFTATMHRTPFTQVVGGNQQGNTKRYTPQLMETVRHSFRPGKKPAKLFSSAGLETQSSRDAIGAANRIEADHDSVQESRFSYSSLLRRRETRRHSFRVPDLPAIPSSGSEESIESDLPQMSSETFATAQGTFSDDTAHPRNGREMSFIGYILPFPRHPSENQLKEQALAAFPNEQVYQQVDHFAIDRDEEEPVNEDIIDIRDPELEFRTRRRASSADLPSELEYLRKHKEEAGMNRRHYFTTRGACFSTCAVYQSSRKSDKPANHDDGWDPNSPFARLRQAASPPMLGGDLIFPQSLTPKTTICEHPNSIGSQGHHDHSLGSGLWSASPCSSAKYDIGGLWNGTCKLDRHPTHGVEILSREAVTLKKDVINDNSGNLDASFKASDLRHRNPQCAVQSPRNESNDSECIDQEFNDDFVTQIYDYLSLGYPSIGRYFDHELSRVSGLPVAALRADDSNMDAKGHVGVHDITNRGVANRVCMRWTALKLYIHEWARQHPRMLEAGHYHETWGVSERKGSWAV
ncbi:hypothetical protein BDW60DRAFT_16641 [Aspergillus nidulans var. acristatus]